jgi:putative ABC transport system substrate-binding protein
MLGESLDSAALRAWYAPERRDVVIALGAPAVQALREVPNDLRVVIGAVRAVTDVPAGRYTGIGLTPDPERIFDRVKGLAPQVRRVLVVYGPERGEWLSARAQLAARKHGLQIEERVAAGLHEAATLYREALADAKSTDAVWLPLNASPVDDRVILPMILEKAWERRLVVVSSNPAHVRRGVSFAFYPDNKGLGTSLAALALQGTGKGKGEVAGLQPLQDLLLAVNLRTAEHVGLHFSLEQQRDFDLVFPSP